MKTWRLFILGILALPLFAQAQFEDGNEGGSDEFSDEFKDDVEKSGAGAIDNELKSEKSESVADAPQPAEEVTDDDIKKLSDARKTRSEANLVKAASEILGKDPKNKYALNTLAVFYYENKKYGVAKILLRRALKDHPEESALHNNLGIIYLAEGEMRLALESFKKSVSGGIYRIGATNLSSIYLEYRDYKKSVGPLEDSYKAARTDLRRGAPQAVEIANNYAIALMGIGENSQAEKVFEEIAESETRNPIPFLNYATFLVEVQKKKKDAIRVISKLKFMSEDRDVLQRVEELERKMEQ